MALLDAILEPDWESRYYSFNAHWAEDEAVASMRNGEGDDYFIVFTPAGALIKGFAPKAPLSPYRQAPPHLWPGVLDGVPQAFAAFLSEPAFRMDETTFLLWRTPSDTTWQHGPIQFPHGKDPDGSARLLAVLDGNPKSYQKWAQEYYERPVNLSAVTHIYGHRALSQEIVQALNSPRSLDDLAEDIQEIGYS